MPLIYCGIDEAGYGPTLGPLCVGCAMFQVDGWAEGDAAPDLWKLLSRAVCREAGDKRHRIAVNDSKKLKLANSSVRHHPLHHLERGVLAFLSCCDGVCHDGPPCSDLAYLAAAGVSPIAECWYGGDPGSFPCGQTAGEIAIAANTLRLALASNGVAVLGLRAEAVGEAAFNELVDAAGTKAAVTESVLVRYLAEVWDRHAIVASVPGEPSDGVRVVCDRQGGRTQYTHMLSHAFPDADITVVAETPLQSKYELRSRLGPDPAQPARRMSVAFKVEAESAHMPVALASMIAKLTREVLMARFNRYWCGRMPELKPTAGYALDARRWLRDVHDLITPQERRGLVRRA